MHISLYFSLYISKDRRSDSMEKLVIILAVKKFSADKLHGFSPLANYTDRATTACRQS
jgi:hypothetical protein